MSTPQRLVPPPASSMGHRSIRGTILLAAYDEVDAIRPVLAEIEEAVSILQRSGIHLDVVLVDDNSPDGTKEAAVATAEQLGLSLEVLQGERSGLGAAMQRGIAHVLANVTTDFLVTMDADGQHDARQIPDLVRAHLSRRSDVTIGSRWVRGGESPGTSMSRSVMSKVGNLLARRITGIRGVADATTSFRVIQPAAAAAFSADNLQVDGYGFFSAFIALTQAHGFTIDEVPICFRPRYSGMSKLTLRDLLVFFTNLFRIRREVQRVRSARPATSTVGA